MCIQATNSSGFTIVAKSHSLSTVRMNISSRSKSRHWGVRLIRLKTLELKCIAFGAAEQFWIKQSLRRMGSLNAANYFEAFTRRFAFRKWLKSGASSRAPNTFK